MTGNFGFIKEDWPEIYTDCARAESYVRSDPRSACFYGRRATERLVSYLYELLTLAPPYRDDLAARINDAAFKTRVGIGITQKLNIIRRIGNTAVHDQRPIAPDAALAVLTELHHVAVWAAFRFTRTPESVPTRTAFDPALVSAATPLSRGDLAKLAERFKAQDDSHRRELAERDELVAARDAELAELREQIRAARAATTRDDDRDYNEEATRDLFIDVLLREAGWPLDQDRDREFEVTGMPNAQGIGYADYVLWGADGLPLAVIEAKRSRSSAAIGQQQASLYADALERRYDRRPVIFYTNGYEHWLWDDAAGYPPREVQGFYTRDELELLIQRRAGRSPLGTAPVDHEIAGRHYQERAIRAVGETFEARQREALLVMATGSGKTRTTIALVDQLMKAGWVKRVLFLADRTALVAQAANAFKQHLPSATTVNLVTEKSADGRVYVSTYPTILNLINETGEGDRRFGPGYFDLIVIDEAHRSVYQKYGAIFDWFDSLLVGLTATPKDEVDHNTYRLFHLEDGVPTDAYSLDEAVAEGYLVPPRGVAAETKFLREGIRYDELSASEQEEWESLEWGDEGPPDAVSSEELNRFLFNEDTVDKVLAALMVQGYKVDSGDRLAKTIIFAKNTDHAEFIQKRFDVNYPELVGKFARVITHNTPYAQSLIENFSTPTKAPQIAISVDMLDTGIDVPDIANLVFFKIVRSKAKFWQMIGRGTRLSPDLFGPGQPKQNFLVFDFCGNLDYFRQDLPGSTGSVQKSLNQRLFEQRVGLVAALGATGTDAALRESAIAALHQRVAGMTLDNFLVRPQRRWVETYAQRESWDSLSGAEASEVATHLGGLPSALTDSDEDAKRFDLLILRRQLAQLEGDSATGDRIRAQIQRIAAGLLTQTAIPSIAEAAALLDEMAGDEWWVDAPLDQLERARVRVRGLLHLLERAQRNRVYTDFADELGDFTTVELPGITPGTDWERFRAKATAYLRQHEDHLAVQRLRRNKQLTNEDLVALEEMLLASGAGRAQDIASAAERSEGLGVFIRSLVGLDRQAAAEVFSRYLDGTHFGVDQIRFVTLIVDELTANGTMTPARLFESPYIDTAPTGPEALFAEAEVAEIVQILRRVTATASPSSVA